MPNVDFRPAIKWNRKEKVFVVLVPEIGPKIGTNFLYTGNASRVYVCEYDMYRLINADKGNWDFSFEEEQGDLADDEYLGISVVQAYWYLSHNTLKIAKRVSKKVGYPQWVYLSRRNRGESEDDRKEYLRENYFVIREKLVERNNVKEFVELERIVNNLTRTQALKLLSQLRNELF